MTDWTGTPPVILAGDIPTGDDWDLILDELTALSDDWAVWVPVWSTSGTAPSVGDGTLTGRYKQIGKTVHYNMTLTWGTTTSAGTGTWSFTTPIDVQTARLPLPTMAIDVSAALGYPCVARTTTASPNILAIYTSTPAVIAGSTVPFVWANTDQLIINGTYEAE